MVPTPVLSNALRIAHLEYRMLALPVIVLVVSESATESWTIIVPQKWAGVPPPPDVLLALDDDHTEELEPALYAQAAIHQQDTLTFLAADGGAGTGNVNDRKILTARTGGIARAPPVGAHVRIARAARQGWRDRRREVLRRQRDIGPARKLVVGHVPVRGE